MPQRFDNEDELYPQQRNDSPGRRANDNNFCVHHEENTMAIGRHSGQWTLLLWILGLGIAAMVSIAGTAYYSQKESLNAVVVSVHSIDKMVTNYIAGNTIHSRESFRRIEMLEDQVNSIDGRLHVIEKQRPPR